MPNPTRLSDSSLIDRRASLLNAARAYRVRARDSQVPEMAQWYVMRAGDWEEEAARILEELACPKPSA